MAYYTLKMEKNESNTHDFIFNKFLLNVPLEQESESISFDRVCCLQVYDWWILYIQYYENIDIKTI